MKRISTGIEGLDEMLNGGLIPGRAYLVKGGPGAGKTTLAMQFLMEGVRRGEKGLYITLEESVPSLKQDMANFGFDLNNPNLKLIDATPVGKTRNIFADLPFENFAMSFEKLSKSISEELRAERYSRIVIDPLTMIRLTIDNELEYRRAFMEFLKVIAGHGATIILTSEMTETDIEEYLVSGVIELRTFERYGKPVRGIKITKFRGSPFDEEMRPYKITNRGIVVYPHESIF